MDKKFYCERCKRKIEPFYDDANGKPQICKDCFKKITDDANLDKTSLRLQGEPTYEEVIFIQQLKRGRDHITVFLISELNEDE